MLNEDDESTAKSGCRAFIDTPFRFPSRHILRELYALRAPKVRYGRAALGKLALVTDAQPMGTMSCFCSASLMRSRHSMLKKRFNSRKVTVNDVCHN